MSTLFNMREDWISTQSGISRKRIKNYRESMLIKNHHFDRRSDGIFYSAIGTKAIVEHFQLNIEISHPSESSQSAPEKTILPTVDSFIPRHNILLLEDKSTSPVQEQAKDEFPTHLIIKSVPRNTRILICLLGDKEVTVHIRDNRKLISGMKIPVIKLGERIEFNAKLPRRRGILI